MKRVFSLVALLNVAANRVITNKGSVGLVW